MMLIVESDKYVKTVNASMHVEQMIHAHLPRLVSIEDVKIHAVSLAPVEETQCVELQTIDLSAVVLLNSEEMQQLFAKEKKFKNLKDVSMIRSVNMAKSVNLEIVLKAVGMMNNVLQTKLASVEYARTHVAFLTHVVLTRIVFQTPTDQYALAEMDSLVIHRLNVEQSKILKSVKQMLTVVPSLSVIIIVAVSLDVEITMDVLYKKLV